MSPEKGPGLTIHEVAKAQELVYELKVGEIMTTNLTTIAPSATMHEVKNLLRDKRISGIPCSWAMIWRALPALRT